MSTQDELDLALHTIKEQQTLVTRAKTAEEAYQQAWHDEILKRQSAESKMEGTRERISDLIRKEGHVTKADLEVLLDQTWGVKKDPESPENTGG